MKRRIIHRVDGSKYKTTPQRRGANRLLEDIRIIIESERNGDACSLASGSVMLFWQIGKKIRNELNRIRERKRRDTMLSKLSKNLSAEYGDCFSKKSLVEMTRFCKSFSDARTASLLAHNLEWSHFKTLITIRNPLKRNFYAEMARMQAWSPEELKEHISGMLFEHTSMNGKENTSEKTLFDALRDSGNSLDEFIYDDHEAIDW